MQKQGANKVNYTTNKMVFRIASKKQQENIILFAVVMGQTA